MEPEPAFPRPATSPVRSWVRGREPVFRKEDSRPRRSSFTPRGSSRKVARHRPLQRSAPRKVAARPTRQSGGTPVGNCHAESADPCHRKAPHHTRRLSIVTIGSVSFYPEERQQRNLVMTVIQLPDDQAAALKARAAAQGLTLEGWFEKLSGARGFLSNLQRPAQNAVLCVTVALMPPNPSPAWLTN